MINQQELKTRSDAITMLFQASGMPNWKALARKEIQSLKRTMRREALDDLRRKQKRNNQAA